MTHPLTQDLLTWYDEHKRDLPWRTNRTPYGTLVSEVMLQQTRVDTVIPYYDAFLKKFPSVEDLANADLNDVLSMWSGLGYYSRARNLHKAANQIVAMASFPNSLKEIRSLSGVGEYIAGAIGSMAFNLDVGAIDGNLHRVLSRVFCDGGDRKRMWTVIEALLPKGRCGDFNQALMDLGSSMCKKKAECTVCPIQNHCLAFSEGTVSQFPVTVKKKKKQKVAFVALLIQKNSDAGTIWMGQRPPEKLYGGMVEPCLVLDSTTDTLSPSDWIQQNLLNSICISTQHTTIEWSDKGRFVHILTHKRMEIRVLECVVSPELDPTPWFQDSETEPYESMKWYDSAQRQSVGVSTLAQKILDQSKKGQLSLF